MRVAMSGASYVGLISGSCFQISATRLPASTGTRPRSSASGRARSRSSSRVSMTWCAATSPPTSCGSSRPSPRSTTAARPAWAGVYVPPTRPAWRTRRRCCRTASTTRRLPIAVPRRRTTSSSSPNGAPSAPSTSRGIIFLHNRDFWLSEIDPFMVAVNQTTYQFSRFVVGSASQ